MNEQHVHNFTESRVYSDTSLATSIDIVHRATVEVCRTCEAYKLDGRIYVPESDLATAKQEIERLTAALQVATTGEVLLARKLSEQAMELQAANEDAERLIESLFKDVGARKQVLALHQQRLAASDDALAHGSEPPIPAAECAHLPVDVLRWAISAASMHLVRIGGLTRAHAEWCRNCGAVSVNSEPWMLANTGGSSI